ncbi:MAG: thermonuclease family protein [Oligoflexia bacterium]|nr:thermonuclease family protein [Oligoflexia bacterium]
MKASMNIVFNLFLYLIICCPLFLLLPDNIGLISFVFNNKKLIVFCSKVLDGDTIIFDKKYYGRLAYIDAPEMKQRSVGKDNVPVGELAYKYLKQKIEGKFIKIKIIEKDKYGRYVIRIWIWNDKKRENNKVEKLGDINLQIVEDGYAVLYTFAQFESLEEKMRYVRGYFSAYIGGKGVWSSSGLMVPYKYRKIKRKK